MTKRGRGQFASAGAFCTGCLFLPAADADLTATTSDDQPGSNARHRLPLVLLAHGFSGTMDRLFPHAERFARAGFAALVFDYRGFGESAGSPRQVVDLDGQRRDIPGVDAVVAQIPFNGYPRETNKSAGERLRLVAAMVWDALRGRLGLSPAYIKEYPGTHFDFYREPALRDRVLADQVHFLREHLAA
jgi:pimeloyl-ACP methyl ester carboxylesterase